MHGLGNDFIFIAGEHIIDEAMRRFCVRLCDRHFGIGADGVVFVLPPSGDGDFAMRIINSDGSEAEMCGNATRCFAKYVYDYGLTDKTEIGLETRAGMVYPSLHLVDGRVERVTVNMGKPRFDPSAVPIAHSGEAIDYPLEVNGQQILITAVSMGNPHCVVFVDDLSRVDVVNTGRALETHPFFPRKTNVEFVEVVGPEELKMAVWERGAGLTLACGTGSAATLVAAARTGRSRRQATIHLPGGDLWMEWRQDNCIYMTGPAEEVFSGVWKVK